MEETGQALPVWMDYGALSPSAGIALEQFRRREIVHAYLISGALGLGKATFARVLTSALFCVSEAKPCGRCEGCGRVFSGTNPDVITLTPEGTKQIGVERVREVIETISRHAFGQGMRVVIVEPVEKMTAQAQNCLLKSLEEPVSNVVFLLLCHEMTALLGTIASRCARVKLTPWPDAVMERVLLERGYDKAQVEGVLPLASGNMGQAIRMLEGTDKDREIAALVFKSLNINSDADVVSISTEMKDDRDSAERYLSALEQALHQSLMLRTGQLSELSGTLHPAKWQRALKSATLSSLTGLLQAVMKTRRLRGSQVNWQSSIDQLMMKILEEKTKWHQ